MFYVQFIHPILLRIFVPGHSYHVSGFQTEVFCGQDDSSGRCRLHLVHLSFLAWLWLLQCGHSQSQSASVDLPRACAVPVACAFACAFAFGFAFGAASPCSSSLSAFSWAFSFSLCIFLKLSSQASLMQGLSQASVIV